MNFHSISLSGTRVFSLIPFNLGWGNRCVFNVNSTAFPSKPRTSLAYFCTSSDERGKIPGRSHFLWGKLFSGLHSIVLKVVVASVDVSCSGASAETLVACFPVAYSIANHHFMILISFSLEFNYMFRNPYKQTHSAYIRKLTCLLTHSA